MADESAGGQIKGIASQVNTGTGNQRHMIEAAIQITGELIHLF
jgi:hypothetical protein